MGFYFDTTPSKGNTQSLTPNSSVNINIDFSFIGAATLLFLFPWLLRPAHSKSHLIDFYSNPNFNRNLNVKFT